MVDLLTGFFRSGVAQRSTAEHFIYMNWHYPLKRKLIKLSLQKEKYHLPYNNPPKCLSRSLVYFKSHAKAIWKPKSDCVSVSLMVVIETTPTCSLFQSHPEGQHPPIHPLRSSLLSDPHRLNFCILRCVGQPLKLEQWMTNIRSSAMASNGLHRPQRT